MSLIYPPVIIVVVATVVAEPVVAPVVAAVAAGAAVGKLGRGIQNPGNNHPKSFK
jgi:hypothetical protein